MIKSIDIRGFRNAEDIYFNPEHRIAERGKESLALLLVYASLSAITPRKTEAGSISKKRVTELIEKRLKGNFRIEKFGELVRPGKKAARVIIKTDDGLLDYEISGGSSSRVCVSSIPEKWNDNCLCYVSPRSVIEYGTSLDPVYENFDIPIRRSDVDLSLLLSRPKLKEISEEALRFASNYIATATLGAGRVFLEGTVYKLWKSNGDIIRTSLLSSRDKVLAELLLLINNGAIKRGSILMADCLDTIIEPSSLDFLFSQLKECGVQVIETQRQYKHE